MPYKSLSQERFFHANAKKLSKQGVNISEWDKSSKGLKLPMKAKKITKKFEKADKKKDKKQGIKEKSKKDKKLDAKAMLGKAMKRLNK
jgi:hypothetical protein